MNICPNCKTSHDSTACPTPSGEGLACDDLLSQMDYKRGMYFFNWLMGEWLSDPDGLEHVSVKAIIEKYANHRRHSIFSDNAQEDIPEQK